MVTYETTDTGGIMKRTCQRSHDMFTAQAVFEPWAAWLCCIYGKENNTTLIQFYFHLPYTALFSQNK